MKHEKIVANTVNVRLFKSGLPMIPKAVTQGSNVTEGGSVIGLVVSTSASVLSDVAIPA
jgi:hypothetical protein